MLEAESRITKNHFVALVCNIAIALFFYFQLLLKWDSSPELGWEKRIAVLALLQFVINLTSLIIMKVSILDYRVWYTFLIQIFTYGRIFLIALEKNDYQIWKNLATNYTDAVNWKAGLLALTCTQCFFAGMLFVKNKSEVSANVPNEIDDDRKALYFNIGLVLVIALLPFKILTDYQNILYMKSIGTYGQASVNGIVGNLALLYPVGFVFLVYSKKWKEAKCGKLIILYSVIMLFITIYTGDRRNVITSILALVLCFVYVYRPHISLSRLILFFFVGVIVLLMLVVVRKIRATGVGSIDAVVSLMKNDISIFDVIWESFSEYGITYYTYSNAVRFYPDSLSFFGGSTYLLFWLISVPGIGVVFPKINDLTSTAKYPESVLHYSVGGSFGLEAFANVGLFCGVLLFVAGLLFGKYFIKRLYSSSEKCISYYFVLIYFFLSIPRASFLEFSRQVIWTIALTEIAFHIKTRDGSIRK